MQAFYLDQNGMPTAIRDGRGIGGELAIDVSALTANTWYRLMPHRNDGALVSDNNRQLNINTLRSDVLEIEGWLLNILNAGYQQTHVIAGHEGNVVTLREALRHTDGLRDANLQNAIEFVLYPVPVNPFCLFYYTASQDIEIGVAKEDTYTPATIKTRATVGGDTQLVLNFSRIDQIFYRFPTLPSADTALSWGEHYMG